MSNLYVVVSSGEVWGYIDADVDYYNSNYVEYVDNMYRLITSYDKTGSNTEFLNGYINRSQMIDFSNYYNVESVVR